MWYSAILGVMAKLHYPPSYNLDTDGRRYWIVQETKRQWSDLLAKPTDDRFVVAMPELRNVAHLLRLRNEVAPGDFVFLYQAFKPKAIVGVARIASRGHGLTGKGSGQPRAFDFDWWQSVREVNWTTLSKDAVLRTSEKVVCRAGSLFRLSPKEVARLLELMKLPATHLRRLRRASQDVASKATPPPLKATPPPMASAARVDRNPPIPKPSAPRHAPRVPLPEMPREAFARTSAPRPTLAPPRAPPTPVASRISLKTTPPTPPGVVASPRVVFSEVPTTESAEAVVARHARVSAIRLYLEEGFAQEVPQDRALRFSKHAVSARVVVRGSRDGAESIPLASGEVEDILSARERTDLFILAHVIVTRMASGTYTASGGEVYRIINWRPEGPDLDMENERYRVPGLSQRAATIHDVVPTRPRMAEEL